LSIASTISDCPGGVVDFFFKSFKAELPSPLTPVAVG
jgi:hypothetical protein